MTLIRRLIRRPQTVWARRALFQVHLWAGIAVGLYILVVSLTGSAVVFRRELAKALQPPTIVSPKGRRMTAEELGAAAKIAYPRFDVSYVSFSRHLDRAAEVGLARGQRRRERLFDPYTGKDLGDTIPSEPAVLAWFVELHDNLLGGRTGRLVNGAGALLLLALCATGAMIWWPGTARWRRSLSVRWRAGWPRFTWDLHSAIGFWMFAFLLMWAVSGVYLAFPEPFSDLVDYLQPYDPSSRELRFGDEALAWLARIHFGRAWGSSVKTLYVILGFAPALLFVTGAVMWWNRVLRKALGRAARSVEDPVGDVDAADAPLAEPLSPRQRPLAG